MAVEPPPTIAGKSAPMSISTAQQLRKGFLPPIACDTRYVAQAAATPKDGCVGKSPSGSENGSELNGNASAYSRQESSCSSVRTFKAAGTAIVQRLRIANGFSTLRDMGGAVVEPAALKPIRKLGEGAFAVVEEALYDPTAATSVEPQGKGAKAGGGLRVAVKRLKPAIVNHQGDLAAFVQEANLMRKLAHKRIVEFRGMGSSDNSSEEAARRTMFLVQEFMDGGTLKRLVSKQMLDMSRHLYSMEDAFRWAQHIAEGLEYLHRAHPMVIHRDLKLENILLKGRDTQTSEAKIADFGLVALVRPRDRSLQERLRKAESVQIELQEQRSKSLSRLSRFISMRKRSITIQEVWNESFHLAQIASAPHPLPPQQLSGRTGSYMYMAPEMYCQEQYNEKVDIFSFGVIVYELLSRYQMVCAVSQAGTEEEIESYAAKVSQGYRPPLPAAWPQQVQDLIAECWHQDPAQRPSIARVRERLFALRSEGVPQEMQRLAGPLGCTCTVM